MVLLELIIMYNYIKINIKIFVMKFYGIYLRYIFKKRFFGNNIIKS